MLFGCTNSTFREDDVGKYNFGPCARASGPHGDQVYLLNKFIPLSPMKNDFFFFFFFFFYIFFLYIFLI